MVHIVHILDLWEGMVLGLKEVVVVEIGMRNKKDFLLLLF